MAAQGNPRQWSKGQEVKAAHVLFLKVNTQVNFYTLCTLCAYSSMKFNK